MGSERGRMLLSPLKGEQQIPGYSNSSLHFSARRCWAELTGTSPAQCMSKLLPYPDFSPQRMSCTPLLSPQQGPPLRFPCKE